VRGRETGWRRDSRPSKKICCSEIDAEEYGGGEEIETSGGETSGGEEKGDEEPGEEAREAEE